MINKLKRHFIETIAFMLILLFIFWSIGYFCNALFGMKFQIESCWAGFGTLGGAGVLGSIKYLADTFGNSERGKPINYEEVIKNNSINTNGGAENRNGKTNTV